MDKRKWLIGGGIAAVIGIAFFMRRGSSGGAAASEDPGGYIATTLPVYGGANVVTAGPVSTQPIGGSSIADLQAAINAGTAVQAQEATDRQRVASFRAITNQILTTGRSLIGPRVGGGSTIALSQRLNDGGNVINLSSRLTTRLTDRPAPVSNNTRRAPAVTLAPINVKTKVDGGLF